jgi:flagellar motility protein MotE (MotC chaperone)
MAEAQERDINEIDSATPEFSAPEKNRGGKKKKKKKRGCGFFILMLLLAAGASAGLQASGAVDLRPFVYSAAPKIPIVGENLKELMRIPEIYSLTPEERRRLELDEWESIIAESIRSLDARQKELDKVSRDLSAKEKDLDFEREELANRLEALSNDMAANQGAQVSDSQAEEIGAIVGTFGQMSVKNASAIIEKLNPNLAVAVLNGLEEDVRANVLGRMEAATAAMLTERLTELYRNRN